MNAQLETVAAILLQVPAQRASLNIFTAMWLVALVCICIYILRHLTKRSRHNAPLRPGETDRGPSNNTVIILGAVAALLVCVLIYVVTRG